MKEQISCNDREVATQHEHDARFESQMYAIAEGMVKNYKPNVPAACILDAAIEIAELDCENEHQTPADMLIPDALAIATERADYTTEWDKQARAVEVCDELNRVLIPHGLCVGYANWDTGDQMVLRFVPCELVRPALGA